MSTRGQIVKRRVKEFTEFSTTQGILQAGISKRNVCMGFWLLTTAICAGILIWQIVLLLQQYYSYAVDVQIQLMFQQRIFPAVTICNVNPYKKSIAYQREKINRLENAYMYTARKIVCSAVSYCVFEANDTLEQDSQMYGLDTINNTGVLQQRVKNLLALEAAGYQMQDSTSTFQETIRSCSFNTLTCSSDYWDTFEDLTMGTCFTFNLNSNLLTNRAGPMYGLRAILATNVTEYLATTTAAGLSVLIHDQGQFPFSDSLGYIIQPGTLTTISVTFKQMSRLGAPYGSCSDDKPDGYLYNMSYSAEACRRSIIQHNIMSNCSCYDPNYPVPSNNTFSPCEIPNDVECWENVTRSNESPDCYQPCEEAMYTITTSSAKWPDTSTNFVPGCMEGMYNESCSTAYDENFAMLEVYYEKLNYETVNETPDDPAPTMLANLGGVIGLFLGMSIVSIIEFLVLGFQLVLHIISPKIGRYADYK